MQKIKIQPSYNIKFSNGYYFNVYCIIKKL
nr:MAG TPA: hypothetical protein [Caudoviricetes sp.]